MASINRVLLVGNLTRDPELRYTPSEVAVCSLSIAVNSREKINGQWEDRPDFFDVTVYGAQAEACAQYLAKGRPCGIDGKLRQDRWKDKATDANRSKVIVIAETVQFLGGQQGRESDHQNRVEDVPTTSHADADFGGPSSDDDIPF